MLHIATMYVDTLMALDSMGSVITNLQTNNIDIARIQETHNNNSNDRNEKKTIQSSSVGKW